MLQPRVSNQEMHARISRFSELKPNGIPLMFIDSVLTGHQRMNYSIVGDTASENPEYSPAIAGPHGFQIGMGFAELSNGPAFHTHSYVECFLILQGRWRFYWGNNPGQVDGEAILEPWDFISIPPHIYRGFEVVGEQLGWFFAVLESHAVFTSKDPVWDPVVERAAAVHGFTSDAQGAMVKPANYAVLRDAMHARLMAAEVRSRGE